VNERVGPFSCLYRPSQAAFAVRRQKTHGVAGNLTHTGPFPSQLHYCQDDNRAQHQGSTLLVRHPLPEHHPSQLHCCQDDNRAQHQGSTLVVRHQYHCQSINQERPSHPTTLLNFTPWCKYQSDGANVNPMVPQLHSMVP
jgi:hypothetical protein